MNLPNRGRVAKWSKEKIDELSTLEVRALLANAERLKETEIAAICNELLDARPRGRPAVRRVVPAGVARRLVSRGKAFEMHGVTVRNRMWSRGGVRADGTVVMTVRADEVQKTDSQSSSLLWAPNVDGSRPWSDTPGGQERREHCRLALERGGAEGLLVYGKPAEGDEPGETKADRIDPETVLSLRIEQRGEEYWASWTAAKRVLVNTFE